MPREQSLDILPRVLSLLYEMQQPIHKRPMYQLHINVLCSTDTKLEITENIGW